MKKLVMIIMIVMPWAALVSCDNAIMDAYNDRWGDVVSESGFDTATDVGDIAGITVDGVSAAMVYVKNTTAGITFPTGADDSGTATITRQFFMGQTEVTNELAVKVLQWAYVKGKFSDNEADHNGISSSTIKYGTRELIDLDSSDGRCKIDFNPGAKIFSVEPGYENYPVVKISWYGAIMLCNWLTEMRDGRKGNVAYTGIPADGTVWDHCITLVDDSKTGYRLPSSAEWEFAARYIGQTVPSSGDLVSGCIYKDKGGLYTSLTPGYYWTPGGYSSGASAANTNEAETRLVAWYHDTAAYGVKPVAQKKANQLGIFDMSGNAFESCYDMYDSIYRIRRGSSSYFLYTDDLSKLGKAEIIAADTSSGGCHGFRMVRTR